jgi:hypothetical protein
MKLSRSRPSPTLEHAQSLQDYWIVDEHKWEKPYLLTLRMGLRIRIACRLVTSCKATAQSAPRTTYKHDSGSYTLRSWIGWLRLSPDVTQKLRHCSPVG